MRFTSWFTRILHVQSMKLITSTMHTKHKLSASVHGYAQEKLQFALHLPGLQKNITFLAGSCGPSHGSLHTQDEETEWTRMNRNGRMGQKVDRWHYVHPRNKFYACTVMTSSGHTRHDSKQMLYNPPNDQQQQQNVAGYSSSLQIHK